MKDFYMISDRFSKNGAPDMPVVIEKYFLTHKHPHTHKQMNKNKKNIRTKANPSSYFLY